MIDIVCSVFWTLLVFIASAAVATIFIVTGIVAVSMLIDALRDMSGGDGDAEE